MSQTFVLVMVLVSLVVNLIALVAVRKANRAVQDNLAIIRQINEERAKL